MLSYIVRRLLLIIPTLFGIMLINFLVVQVLPGGPVEQVIAELTGQGLAATSRVSQQSGDIAVASEASSTGAYRETGRAHVCTPVTNAHIVCRLLLEKTKPHQPETNDPSHTPHSS